MKIIALSLLLSVSMTPALIAGPSKQINEGNSLFNDGKYDDALTKYNDAQIESPASPEIYFNMGTVYYKQKKYAEAIDAFQKSTEKADVGLEAKAMYNIGNSLFQQGQLREALEYYKQALERTPDDEDTKYNIEYTENKIKEMLSKAQDTKKKAMQEQARRSNQQKQENNANGSSEKEQANGAAKQKPGSAEKKNGNDKKQGAEEAKDEKQGKSNEQKSVSNRGDKAKEEMSKEEAERFLSAFQNDQKNLTPPQQQESGHARSPRVEKDW